MKPFLPAPHPNTNGQNEEEAALSEVTITIAERNSLHAVCGLTNQRRTQAPKRYQLAPIPTTQRALGGDAADKAECARAPGLDAIAGDETNLEITGPERFARAETILGA